MECERRVRGNQQTPKTRAIAFFIFTTKFDTCNTFSTLHM